MDAYWIPAVNHIGSFGRWAFAELTDVHTMQADFEAAVAAGFERTLASFPPE